MNFAALWQKLKSDKKGLVKKSLPVAMAIVLLLTVAFFAMGNPNKNTQSLGWVSADAFHQEYESEKQAMEQSKKELEEALAKTQEMVNQLTAANRTMQSLLDQAALEKNAIQDTVADMKDAYQQEEENALLKWVNPARGAPCSSYFGYRVQPTEGASTFHSGVDLAAPIGTPIVAARAGKVTVATYDEYSGYHVIIDHYDGYSSRYLHMRNHIVRAGQEVVAGQVIGYCGESGVATGVHLHFSIYLNGEAVNPAKYIDIT
mgnify:CR=1 FL=1